MVFFLFLLVHSTISRLWFKMLYQQQGQQKEDAPTSTRGNANNGVLDVGEINPELEANLVSIAAAAARPPAAQGHPHHPHAENLAASIDPQIELQHQHQHQHQHHHQPDDDHQLRRALEQHHQPQPHPQPQHAATAPPSADGTATNTATATNHNHNHTNDNASSTTTTTQQQPPTVGPDGQPIDPKRTCPFCGRTFSHPGSLGRHLDLKRGTRLHPANKVDLIRGDVKRRGDIVEIKARRSKRAKIYNSRPDVKDRARARRKHKERSDKARGIAKSRFIDRLGVPQLPPHPSFAFMVLYFLPPSQWPHDPPTRQTYDQLQSTLDSLPHESGDLRSKAEVAFEQWSVMNMQTKMDIWAREQRRAAEAAIGSITLYDLGARESWLAMEESRIVSEMAADDQNHPDDDDSSSKHHESTSPHDPEVDAVAAAVVAATNQQNHHHHHRDDVDINANIDEQLFN